MKKAYWAGYLGIFILLSCGGGETPEGSGGTANAGGAMNSGGAMNTGGSVNHTGGAMNTGGMPNTTNGYSLRFYGYGQEDMDRVKIPIDPQVPADIGQGDFTIEFWMKASAADNLAMGCSPGKDNWITGNIILDRDIYGDGGHGDFGLSLFQEGLAFGIATASGASGLCGKISVSDGKWHHIALTRINLSGLVKLFIDGKLDTQMNGPSGNASYEDGRSTAYPNSDPFLVLGAEKHDAGAAYPSYSGFLDELRLSTTVRYTDEFTPNTSEFAPDAFTAALYHCNEGKGTVLGDSSNAAGGPSDGTLKVGGMPAGPEWSGDVPF